MKITYGIENSNNNQKIIMKCHRNNNRRHENESNDNVKTADNEKHNGENGVSKINNRK